MKGAPLRQTAQLSGLDLLYDPTHPSQFGLPQHQLVLRLHEEKAGQVPLLHGGVKTGSHLLILSFQSPLPLQRSNHRVKRAVPEPHRLVLAPLTHQRDHLISVHRSLVEERHPRKSQRIGYLPLRRHRNSFSRYELVEVDYILGLGWCQVERYQASAVRHASEVRHLYPRFEQRLTNARQRSSLRKNVLK